MIVGQNPLAEAFVDVLFDDPSWQEMAERFNWRLQRPAPLTVIAMLDARPLSDGTIHTFTLRFQGEFCPTLPPNVRFVNPDTLDYDAATDAKHVAVITAGWCNVHPTFGYSGAYAYAPQLVCNSLSHGYYITNHTPTPDQQWNPGRHAFDSSIEVIHRALRSPHYNGRHA